MKHQDFNTFKKTVCSLLAIELTKYDNGDIKWNVSNQFDETYLETALERFQRDEAVQYECYAKFNATPPALLDHSGIMSLAHMASDFEVEPLANGWTQ